MLIEIVRNRVSQLILMCPEYKREEFKGEAQRGQEMSIVPSDLYGECSQVKVIVYILCNYLWYKSVI